MMKKSNHQFRLLTLTGYIFLIASVSINCTKPETNLKDTFKEHFYIGTSVNSHQTLGSDSVTTAFLIKHFNSLTSENDMKWEKIHPFPQEYNFRIPDSLISFGKRNGMFIVGHTLVWHSQTPAWVFEDTPGKPLNRDALLQRMKDHIYTVAGTYKGKVDGWDVVNEAVAEDGQLRKSKWFEIIGEDYIQKAFEFASDADPDAELYYNDYNIELKTKREGTVKLIQSLQEKGVKIDGVGIQGHWHLDFPDLSEIDTAIGIYANMGLKVMITELDIDVLPRPASFSGADISQNFELQKQLNPYPDGMPDSVQQQLAGRYADIFKIFLKYSDNISRITFWGTHDAVSWKNNWPVKGRSNYPLLFDRNYQPKTAYDAVIATKK